MAEAQSSSARRLYFVGSTGTTANFPSGTGRARIGDLIYVNSYSISAARGTGGFTDSAFWVYKHTNGRFYRLNDASFFTNLSDRTIKNTDTLFVDSTRLRVTANMSLDSRVAIIELGRPQNGGETFRMSGNVTFTMTNANAVFSIRSYGSLRLDNPSTGNTTSLVLGTVVKAKNTTGSNSTQTGAQISGIAGYGVTAYASSASVASTSGFAGFSLGALPVVLVGFDAVKQGNSVNITWSTQQEFNTNFFQVERSFDGANYQAIAKVAAAGNSTTPRSYSYADGAPARGIAYYRVRIVDLDGKVGFTTVKAIRAVANTAKVSVYPNPAISVANVVVNNTDNQAFSLNVFNRNGQLVSQKRASAGTTAVALEVSALPAGDYIIDVNFADGSRMSSKLVVGKQ